MPRCGAQEVPGSHSPRAAQRHRRGREATQAHLYRGFAGQRSSPKKASGLKNASGNYIPDEIIFAVAQGHKPPPCLLAFSNASPHESNNSRRIPSSKPHHGYRSTSLR
uniref:Uncharacterized protein n=1 Tax=Mycena chlorophos TaxID=658473 RepID=A0ABQ0M2T4_MYCCL|nr:predicted protein [Mycena chlorophos]